MKIDFILKSTTFALLSSLVLANNCDDIKNYFKEKGLEYNKNIKKCDVDSNGKVIALDIESDTLEESDVDKILSYDTIKKLSYYIGIFGNDVNDNTNETENYHFSKYEYFSSHIPKLPNLEDLTLSYNGLREYARGSIGDDTLRTMACKDSLKKLTLVGLDLLQMHVAQIGDLINLEELHIINAAQKRDYDYLSGLLKLKVLEITEFHHNPFVEFPNISNFENLEKLVIRGNEFTSIPSYIADFKKLKYIDLSNNNISKLPEFFNEFPDLEYIDLSFNIDITGKTLTNDKLKTCKYEADEKLCIAKDMKCFEDNINLKKCSSSSTPELPISTDGKCGKDVAKCPSDQCCSKYGFCGRTSSYCGSGCQSEFGKCSNEDDSKLPVSTDGKCGKDVAKCPSGQCCSKYGFCGTNEKYCSIKNGCQSEFGKCSNEDDSELPVSTDGKCGKGVAKCPSGQCCSKYGHCGTSESHCSIESGCQSELGKCNSKTTTTTKKTTSTKKSSSKKTTTKKISTTKKTITTTKKSLPTSTNGKCGKGVAKCPSGQCCSKYGYCGKTSKYCGSGCQSEFGKCY